MNTKNKPLPPELEIIRQSWMTGKVITSEALMLAYNEGIEYSIKKIEASMKNPNTARIKKLEKMLSDSNKKLHELNTINDNKKFNT